MNVLPTKLPGAVVIEPKVFGDSRGYFLESYNANRYLAAGLPGAFVQDNVSMSSRGVLRGLHMQSPHPQGKLVQVLLGEVFDVAVDARAGSPTFGQWAGVTLSAENKRQFYIPEGFLHGFCVTSETAVFAYKCTDLYHPEADCGVIWNDPNIGIEWPVSQPLISEKDARSPRLCDLPRERLTPFHRHAAAA